MVNDIITGLFNFILSLIMTLVEIVCFPLNLLFTNLFPDFNEYVDMIYDGLDSAFNGLSWALSLIPPTIRSVLLFIATIELSLLVVMRSSHITAKAWKLLQKIKFW